MRWLGIDAGGTKTAFTLYDEDLQPIDRFELPTSHYAQAGYDGMRAILTEGVLRAEERKILGERFGIGVGMCGYGEGAESSARIERIVRDVAGARPYELVNDVESAWAAGLGLADGIVVIAGTGSIAYGVHGKRTMRCGGWDYELGDEGSGGWLGKELLRAFTRQCDGRDAAGPLRDLVRKELGLESDFDVIAFAQRYMADRSRISALAPLVSTAAQAGDASARSILARAAREEAEMVAAIVHGIFCGACDGRDGSDGGGCAADGHAGRPVPVTYVGGTFKAGPAILDPLSEALPRCCRLVPPLHEPDRGACLLLQRRLGAGAGSED